MIVFYVILYIFVGLFMFFAFNDLFDDERFYEIFNKRWARIIFRLSWIVLWPLWVLLFVVIMLDFLFEIFIKALTK